MTGLGAAIAHSLGRPADVHAADGDAVIAGQSVSAATTTTIHATSIFPGLIIRADGAGVAAIAGVTMGGGGRGVYGEASGANSSGVSGFSDIGNGLQGLSTNGTGVYGFGPNAASIGDSGQAYNGTGVLAQAGVTGTALRVVGSA
jgi:hypothetical protein